MTRRTTLFLLLLSTSACSSDNNGSAADAGAHGDAHAINADSVAGIYKSTAESTAGSWSYITLKPQEGGLLMDNSYLLPSVKSVEEIRLLPEGDGWKGAGRLMPDECGCTNVCWVDGWVSSYYLTSPSDGSIRVEIAQFKGSWDPISDLGISDFSVSGPTSCLDRDYPAITLGDPHLEPHGAGSVVLAERCPDSGYSGASCSAHSDCCSDVCRFGTCD